MENASCAITNCNGCHVLDPSQGFFGTSGLTTFETETQQFKVPHLNNAYQKVGMFGAAAVAFVGIPSADRQFQGDQVRGFGFLHDGSIATLFDFLHAGPFSLSDDDRLDLEQFVLAFDSTYAPIVGQQVTLTSTNGAVVGPRISLMIARATADFVLVDQPGAKECDLIAKAVVAGEARGYVLNAATGQFQSDRAAEPPLTDAQLRTVANTPGQEVTYTCVPPGEGVQLGIDRDGDGHYDRDELDAGTDPADPNSPGSCFGDCNSDGTVKADEILRLVAIALGARPLGDCTSLAVGVVDVTGVLGAVNGAAGNCAAGL